MQKRCEDPFSPCVLFSCLETRTPLSCRKAQERSPFVLMKYVKACQEAGLSKEQTREIERVYDADKKRNRRRNEMKKEYDISIQSTDQGETIFEIVDDSVNIEAEIIYNEEVKTILDIIRTFREDDQKFIYDYFYKTEENISLLARMWNMARHEAKRRINRLIEQMREEYFKRNPTGETEIFKRH